MYVVISVKVTWWNKAWSDEATIITIYFTDVAILTRAFVHIVRVFCLLQMCKRSDSPSECFRNIISTKSWIEKNFDVCPEVILVMSLLHLVMINWPYHVQLVLFYCYQSAISGTYIPQNVLNPTVRALSSVRHNQILHIALSGQWLSSVRINKY